MFRSLFPPVYFASRRDLENITAIVSFVKEYSVVAYSKPLYSVLSFKRFYVAFRRFALKGFNAVCYASGKRFIEAVKLLLRIVG
jgi:hypothetical protein